MGEILRMIGILLLHMLVYISLGTLILHLLRMREWSPGTAFITGYFGYFTLFEIISLPAEYWGMSTRRLAALTGAIVLLLMAAGLWILKQQMGKVQNGIRKSIAEHGMFLPLVIVIVLLQCLIVALYVDGSQDAAYYVGTANIAVSSNQLGRFDPYTGRKITYFALRYFFSVYPFHNAVVSAASGIPVILQAKIIMPMLHVLAANLIWHRIGRALFKKQSVKYADLFVAVIFVIHCFSNTLFLPGQFYFTRLYEGKAIIANVVLAAVLLSHLVLWNNSFSEKGKESKAMDRAAFVLLFMVSSSAICFAGSGYIAAILSGAAFVPVFFRKPSVRRAVWFVISVLPIACWMVMYLLIKHNIIRMTLQ